MQTNEQLLGDRELPPAQTELPAEPELLYAPIGYSLSGGGKRLRPILVMLSCGIFSDDALQALPAAAAVEMFHNFTLLHDDIKQRTPCGGAAVGLRPVGAERGDPRATP